MYFNRYNRIKTEPQIAARIEDNFIDKKKKLKIKNIRFSLDQQINKATKKSQQTKQIQEKQVQINAQKQIFKKKAHFLQKLPELSHQIKNDRKYQMTEKKVFSFHHYKKKDAFLNSILQILQPNSNYQSHKTKQHNFETKIHYQTPKSYENQFFQQLPQKTMKKNHRSPKLVDTDMFKFKNSTSIAKRKIFSEDKQRSKIERDPISHKKEPQDLQKIEILTFANKFPFFKKQQDATQ